MTRYVLHLTDLHIDDLSGGEEFLRPGMYQEYLEQLSTAIKATLHGDVDALVVTGDFVHRSKVDNFEHAAETLRYFAHMFGLSLRQIFVCPGNHDVNFDASNSGQWSAAKEKYVEFESQFGNAASKIAEAQPYATLCTLNSGVWYLMLDSLFGCLPPNAPGPGRYQSPTQDVDAIVELVRSVPRDKHLIIGSHYSADSDIGATAAFEDEQPDWYQKHLWTAATPLRERILRYRQGKTTWLTGDIHRRATRHFNGIDFVTTGRIGTSSERPESSILRQCGLIELSDVTVNVRHFQFYATQSGAHYGDWQLVGQPGPPIRPHLDTPAGTSTPAPVTTSPVHEVFDNTALLSSELEVDLLRIVSERSYCHWGRFATSGEEVLLSWISFGPLMNEGLLFNSLISAIVETVEVELSSRSLASQDVCLLGIDCWGSILASQVSMLTSTLNFCLAARGRGRFHTSHELPSDSVFTAMWEKKLILLVCDVVATGRTQRWVHDCYVGWCQRNRLEARSDQRWIVVSAISDPDQKLVADWSFVEKHYTAAKVKHPFIQKHLLPIDLLGPHQIDWAN